MELYMGFFLRRGKIRSFQIRTTRKKKLHEQKNAKKIIFFFANFLFFSFRE